MHISSLPVEKVGINRQFRFPVKAVGFSLSAQTVKLKRTDFSFA
jgi:hypothetical protein